MGVVFAGGDQDYAAEAGQRLKDAFDRLLEPTFTRRGREAEGDHLLPAKITERLTRQIRVGFPERIGGAKRKGIVEEEVKAEPMGLALAMRVWRLRRRA
jgi:hypothetical protein